MAFGAGDNDGGPNWGGRMNGDLTPYEGYIVGCVSATITCGNNLNFSVAAQE